MIVAIGVAEIAFWVILLAGLTLRYIARRDRASWWLLLTLPLVDLALVTFVVVDVAGGASPSRSHALAAVYLGVTVAFGHSMVTWADARFRHRFAGGPEILKPAKGSRAAVRALWTEWFRVVLTVVIATAILLVLLAIDGFPVPQSTQDLAEHPYWNAIGLMGVITAIWFLAGPAFAGRGRDEAPEST